MGVYKNHREVLNTLAQTPNMWLSSKLTLGTIIQSKTEIWKENNIFMALFPTKKTSKYIKYCIFIEYYVFLVLFGLKKDHEEVVFLAYFDFECSEYTQSYFG